MQYEYFTSTADEPDRSLVLQDKDGDHWAYVGGGWRWAWSRETVLNGSRNSSGGHWDYVTEEFYESFPFRVVGSQVAGVEVTEPMALQDSGARTQYAGGGVRDSSEGKPRFDLLWPVGVPYEAQFLTQVAQALEQGAKKYEPRNWELFHTPESLEHAKASMGRHYANYMAGSTDEPHLILMACNILMAATIEWKIANGWKPELGDGS